MQSMKEQGIIAEWCITDPPYGIGIGNMSYTKQGAVRNGKAQALTRDYSKTNREWDDIRQGGDTISLIREVSKEQIIFGGNYYTDILPPTKSWIVWDKRMPNLADRCDFADCELAWCSKGVARLFRYMYNGMLQRETAQISIFD